MSYPIQLDFFKSEEECEIDCLRREIAAVRTSTEKVRKGMYARLNEQGKEMTDLKERLMIMERNVCKGVCHDIKIPE